MLKRIIEYCRIRKWPKITVAILLIAICWTAWWFFGRTPFTTSAPEKPQATVSAQKQPAKKKTAPKTTTSATQQDVNEWVQGLQARMDAVTSEKTIEDLSIEELIDQSRDQNHTVSDNVDTMDNLEDSLSDKGKEYTLSTDATGKTPAQKLDDLKATFADWQDAVYYTAWRDIYNTEVSRSYDAYQYALKGIVQEDLPEQCQTYVTKYFSAMPDFDESMSNRKKLDFFKKWYESYQDSQYQCLSHPNKQMAHYMMTRDLSDPSTLGN